jgi:hypothetical protein
LELLLRSHREPVPAQNALIQKKKKKLTDRLPFLTSDRLPFDPWSISGLSDQHPREKKKT